MYYPIAITPSNDVWRITVPDLWGCSATSSCTVEDALDQAQNAVETWISDANRAGKRIPHAKRIDDYVRDRQFDRSLWTAVNVRVPIDFSPAAFPAFLRSLQIVPQEACAKHLIGSSYE